MTIEKTEKVDGTVTFTATAKDGQVLPEKLRVYLARYSDGALTGVTIINFVNGVAAVITP